MAATLLLLATLLAVISLNTLIVSAKPPDWVTPEMLEMVKSDKVRCMAEHGTTEALIDQVNSGNIPNDRAITCYMYCLLEAFSIMDEDGEFEGDMLAGVLPEAIQPKAKAAMDDCLPKMSGADVCEKVYSIGKCAEANYPGVWFMI